MKEQLLNRILGLREEGTDAMNEVAAMEDEEEGEVEEILPCIGS